MVLTDKCSQDLINHFPNFGASLSLKEAIEDFSENGHVNQNGVCTGLSHYITYEIIPNNIKITTEEIDIYRYVEISLVNYTSYPKMSVEEEFANALCVCFLENLINCASFEIIEYSRFIPYLGEESKKFCRAWDEFTGVKSEGLW